MNKETNKIIANLEGCSDMFDYWLTPKASNLLVSYIKELQQENEQLKDNWNKLKKFLEEWKENEEYCYLASSPIDRCRKDIYGEILDKMQELEKRK